MYRGYGPWRTDQLPVEKLTFLNPIYHKFLIVKNSIYTLNQSSMFDFAHRFTCFHRSVGVSNFNIHHLEGLEKAELPTPSVNQIELHPWMRRAEAVNYCRQEGITVMGYSPLAKGQNINDPTIASLSKKFVSK